jgi:homoserine O-acetyltransferase
MSAPSRYSPGEAFVTEAGVPLPGVELTWRSWGQLSAAADNAVVVCHALTGSSDVESWWPSLLGSGRALDPDRDFIVSVDALGSCHGSTGPLSTAPTGTVGPRFPAVSVRDQVRAAARPRSPWRARHSTGAGRLARRMLALEWARRSPWPP